MAAVWVIIGGFRGPLSPGGASGSLFFSSLGEVMSRLSLLMDTDGGRASIFRSMKDYIQVNTINLENKKMHC